MYLERNQLTMKKRHRILILLTLIATFLLVYKPHLSYPMPYHIDEWHHISESIRMGNYGEYFEILRLESANKFSGLEMGFHFFLFLLSFVFNLVSVYQFMPALWASLSALVLFYVVYKKTNRNFLVAWLSMIFFISIRSNVNLTGLWFFTPLTFAIPLIFLYTYFFTEGIEKQNKTNILISLGIMLLLIPTHSISVLFIIPTFIIYLLIHYKYLLKEYLFFSLFLIIPITGILFFKYTFDVGWNEVLPKMIKEMQFQHGWGILEVRNSFTEVYSLMGYALAVIGLIFIATSRKLKKYSFYIIWPITAIVMMTIYRLTSISFFSPYQRNLYYLAIGLPMISAIGLYSIIKIVKPQIQKIIKSHEAGIFSAIKISVNIDQQYTKILRTIAGGTTTIIIIVIATVFSFANYYNLPPDLSLYKVIEPKHYEAIKFLSQYTPTKVMATPFISTAIYPISGHDPVGTVVFYGDRRIVEAFFIGSDCRKKEAIVDEHSIGYIISPIFIGCNMQSIYEQDGINIYKTNI
jgi:hypothetical protein